MSWVWMAIRLIERASPSLPEPFQHACRLQAQVQMLRDRFGQHDLVGFGTGFLPRWDDPFPFRTAVGRNDSVLATPGLEDTEDAAWSFVDPAQASALRSVPAPWVLAAQEPAPPAQAPASPSFRGASGSLAAGRPRVSHSTGRASASPSWSVPVICTIAVSGSTDDRARATEMMASRQRVSGLPRCFTRFATDFATAIMSATQCHRRSGQCHDSLTSSR